MNVASSLALIIISVGTSFFFGKPLLSDASALKEERVKFEEAVEKARQIEERKNELLARLNEITAVDRERIETFLPTREGVVRLVADIDGIAAKYGISIDAVSSGESNSDVTRSASDTEPTSKYYGTKSLTLDFSAGYADLVAFLIDLEKSLRVIDIRSIDLSSSIDETGKSTGVYQYRVTGDIYWLKGENEKQ